MARFGKYLTRDGRHAFEFRITARGGRHEVVCVRHPPLNGADSDVHTTHLYGNGRVCFSSGSEPQSVREAESRAVEWAEFFSGHVSGTVLL